MQSKLELTKKEDKNEDEKIKEDMCADVELNFMKKLDRGVKRIILKKDEIKFISFHIFEPEYRMYGRIRFSCDKPYVKARSMVTPYEDDLVIAIFDAYLSGHISNLVER